MYVIIYVYICVCVHVCVCKNKILARQGLEQCVQLEGNICIYVCVYMCVCVSLYKWNSVDIGAQRVRAARK